MKSLPMPANVENSQKVNGGDAAYQSAAPPPYDGGQPSHNYQSHPAGSPSNFNSSPPQQFNGGYGGMQPGGQTTVIVGQQPDNTGMMLATGMVGGALLGYGLGSCFAPGFGMHGGFGGGYVSNNETTVNNYYGSEAPAENGAEGDQNAEYGGGDIGGGDFGGADYGDMGGGGDTGGGFDFGGGDFGGGDFGGGDF
uniref:Uncharacterized protein n=1 Tax=Panagrolaimus davidi TaxID=227884 RepID=A0A914QPY5_9BILA